MCLRRSICPSAWTMRLLNGKAYLRALDVPASSANIRHARAHHQGAFARRHLVGSPNAKKAPAHDAVIPARTHGRRRWTIDDETRRYCVLMVPFALKLFFGLNPELERLPRPDINEECSFV